MLHPTNALTPPPSWPDASAELLAVSEALVAAGVPPAPLLLAYEGDEPLATVVLRPFGGGELTDVLIEILALLLPVGVDRVALALPGRAWSTLDPIPPVTDDIDLRAPLVVLAAADAGDGTCQLRTSLHPYREGEGFDDEITFDEPPEAPALHALQVLLEARDELPRGPDPRLAAQLARVLLRGHEVALAPRAAARIELATNA